jgi:outer membrane protein, multidrug efflux system
MSIRVAKTAVLVNCAAALLITGCSLIPAYQRPEAPVATQFPDSGAAHAASTADKLTAAASWRQFVLDQQLQTLIELALANNRDLRVAVLNVELSQAQYRNTRSASFPALNATGTYSAQGNSQLTTHQSSASLGMSAYTLDLFGRIRSLNAQAFEQYLATEAGRQSAHIALIAGVATQYLALQQAQEQIVLTRQTLAAVEDTFKLNQLRYNAGETNELDLRASEGQAFNARNAVLTYERQRAQATHALDLLVGAPTEHLTSAESMLPVDVFAELAPGVPSDLLQRRPDIVQAEHTLRAANANIGAARAAFFPSISLTGLVGSSSNQLSGLFSGGNGNWSFVPQINMPIFSGGAHRAALDAATTTARIDVAQYEKAIQTAFREVADAVIAIDSYQQQAVVETGAITAQQRRLTLATLRYRQGEDSFLNVLTAQQDLYNAQQGLLTARFGRLDSQVALYQALGGGWQ